MIQGKQVPKVLFLPSRKLVAVTVTTSLLVRKMRKRKIVKKIKRIRKETQIISQSQNNQLIVQFSEAYSLTYQR